MGKLEMDIFLCFSAAGNDYSSIRGCFGQGAHVGRTPPSALWVLTGMDPLSPHLSSMFQNAVNLNSRVHVLCLCVGSHGLGGAFVEAVNLIEMKRERKGLLFFPPQVNEKLLVSQGLCVGGQTAGVMWERGHRKAVCQGIFSARVDKVRG